MPWQDAGLKACWPSSSLARGSDCSAQICRTRTAMLRSSPFYGLSAFSMTPAAKDAALTQTSWHDFWSGFVLYWSHRLDRQLCVLDVWRHKSSAYTSLRAPGWSDIWSAAIEPKKAATSRCIPTTQPPALLSAGSRCRSTSTTIWKVAKSASRSIP